MTMHFKDYLKHNAQRIDKTLDAILLGFLSETKKTEEIIFGYIY